MFVDQVRIFARAGKGGDGCCSFRRVKYNPKGGPDGGDGGKGADIIIKVNPHRNNLEHLKFKPHFFAPDGQPGKGQNKTGRSGKNLTIEVPPGTVIHQIPADETSFLKAGKREDAFTILDLTEPERQEILCDGGKGGIGNQHFKSSTNQAPTRTIPGKPGSFGQYILELKSIADVGLVGFPNAGKSSLLHAISHATPKIGAYPFTTLKPTVGVIEFDDYTRMTMADIPGLIEGAHEGVGLGFNFLKHIERCRILAFVLDIAGSEGRDPLEDFMKLREEISLYDEALKNRPFFIIANKIDLPEAEKNIQIFRERFGYPIIPISASENQGISELKTFLQNHEQRHIKPA